MSPHKFCKIQLQMRMISMLLMPPFFESLPFFHLLGINDSSSIYKVIHMFNFKMIKTRLHTYLIDFHAIRLKSVSHCSNKLQCCKMRYFRAVEPVCHANTFCFLPTAYITISLRFFLQHTVASGVIVTQGKKLENY